MIALSRVVILPQTAVRFLESMDERVKLEQIVLIFPDIFPVTSMVPAIARRSPFISPSTIIFEAAR